MSRPRRWDEVLSRLPSGPCQAAEIGVWRGAMSRQLLAAHRKLVLTLVDPWKAGAPGDPWYDSGSRMAQCSQKQVDQIKAEAIESLRFATGRFRVIEERSVKAARLVEDESLDLVFIDADHSYGGVRDDIDAWLPKVRPGGWIGGHDYRAVRFPGVERAVHERFVTCEAGANSTWFVRVGVMAQAAAL